MWLFSKDAGASFPYDVGAAVETLGDWRLHQCTSRRKEAEDVSALVCDVTPGSSLEARAKGLMKRMKTLRHPNLLPYLDGLETSKCITIITEKVVPLASYLQAKADSGNFTFMTSWGLYQIGRGVSFLNRDCKLLHCNLRMSSILVTKSGEWKVGGLDWITPIAEQLPNDIPHRQLYWPADSQKIDGWGLGCLVWEVFNRALDPSSGRDQLRHTQAIPAQLSHVYLKLIHVKAQQRMDASRFVETCRAKSGFMDNFYVDTLLFLEEMTIKDADEKLSFLSSLADRVDSFPDDIAKYKILPHLLNAFQYGGGGIEVLLPVLKLAKLLEQVEFEKTALPCLVAMFSSPDRATRVRLLELLPQFVDNLPDKVVNDQILPPVALGFVDSNPVVREATIRAMVHMASKLSDKNLNEVLPRHLTHLQVKDDQGGVRTNATVCLAKLSGGMNTATRQGPVFNSFLKCTRDPFPPARQASVSALSASITLYSVPDLAGKLLPCLAFLTVDSVKDVRQAAFKAMRAALTRLEQASEDPDSVKVETGNTSVITGSGVSWTNWAVSAISKLSTRTPNQDKSDSTSSNHNKPNSTSSNHNIPNSTSSNQNRTKVASSVGDHKDITDEKPKKERRSKSPIAVKKSGGSAMVLGKGGAASKSHDPFDLISAETNDSSFDQISHSKHQPASTYNWDAKPASNYNWDAKPAQNDSNSWEVDDDDDWGSLDTPALHTTSKPPVNDWDNDSFFADLKGVATGSKTPSIASSTSKPASVTTSTKPSSASKPASKLGGMKLTGNKKKSAADSAWNSWGDEENEAKESNDWGDW